MNTIKTYPMGSANYKWNMDCEILQNHTSYKYILSELDDDFAIETSFVTPSTANYIYTLISNITSNSVAYENLHDVFERIKRDFLGNLFFEEEKSN